MLNCRNAEGVHGNGKVGNACAEVIRCVADVIFR